MSRRYLRADGRIVDQEDPMPTLNNARDQIADARAKYLAAADLLARLENLSDPTVQGVAMAIADVLSAGLDRARTTEVLIDNVDGQQ